MEFPGEKDGHGIEEEWDIEDRIDHSNNLPCYCHWYEISETDCRSRDDGEVERIEIARSEWMTDFDSMDCDGSEEPREEKNDRDDEELFSRGHIYETKIRVYLLWSRYFNHYE